MTALLLGVAASLSACGPRVDTLATEAMNDCIAARNPVFTSGHGADALKTPLSERAEALAHKLAYARGLKIFSRIAESAKDQVTLVCALDMIAHNGDIDARIFVQKYLKHPSPDVALNARLLLARPVPKPY